MDSKVFFAGGLVLLLLFGCVGRGGTPAPPVQKPQTLPGPGIGDADIDVSEPVNDTELTTNVSEVEPPENGATQGGVASSTLEALDSEMFVTQINETDLIMEVEGVEPG